VGHPLMRSPAVLSMMAVDGRVYSPDVLNKAIAHSKDGKITLIGERIPGTHDYLSEYSLPAT